MYDTVGEFLQDTAVAYTQHYTTPFTEQNRNYWWVPCTEAMEAAAAA